MAKNNIQPAQPLDAIASDRFPGGRLPDGGSIEDTLPEITLRKSDAAPEPRRSFFRGAAVGIGIMLPIWVWLILKFLR